MNVASSFTRNKVLKDGVAQYLKRKCIKRKRNCDGISTTVFMAAQDTMYHKNNVAEELTVIWRQCPAWQSVLFLVYCCLCAKWTVKSSLIKCLCIPQKMCCGHTYKRALFPFFLPALSCRWVFVYCNIHRLAGVPRAALLALTMVGQHFVKVVAVGGSALSKQDSCHMDVFFVCFVRFPAAGVKCPIN